MSFWSKNIKCEVCNKLVDDYDRFFKSNLVTSGAYLPDNDIRIYYTAMHWECYIDWEYREEYALKYTNEIIRNETIDVNWAKIYLDDNFLIMVRLKTIDIIRVVPLKTGEFIDVQIERLHYWIERNRSNFKHSKFDKDMYALLIPIFINNFSNRNLIMDRIDYKSKKEIVEKRLLENNEIKIKEQERIESYNKELYSLYKQFKNCPKCNSSESVRYVDTKNKRKSYLVCNQCGKSLRLEDVKR